MEIVKKAQAIVNLQKKVDDIKRKIATVVSIQENKRDASIYVGPLPNSYPDKYEELYLEIPSEELLKWAKSYLKTKYEAETLNLYKHIANAK